MSTVTLKVPHSIQAGRPHQSIESLGDSQITVRTIVTPDHELVVAHDEGYFILSTAGWEIRAPIAKVFGVRVTERTHGPQSFVSFALEVGSEGGIFLLTGLPETTPWFQELAQRIHDLIPGGVLWNLK